VFKGKSSIASFRKAQSDYPESRKKQQLTRHWIPDLGFASSGMTIFYGLFQQPSQKGKMNLISEFIYKKLAEKSVENHAQGF
jgi:phosphoribosylaminoimidazole-succinocarboxamide synthase